VERPIRAVLLDLDGTLVDTAPALAAATNGLRARHGLAALPYAAIRPWVGHGAAALTQVALGLAPDAAGFAAAEALLLELYRQDITRDAALFRGMPACLAGLAHRGLPWGIVTNKPTGLTLPLLAALGLDAEAACVVCGDTTPWSKPHPAPLLHACRLIGCAPVECVYLGDAERDIVAARAAGMPSLVATWGYLEASDRPEDWGADHLIATPQGLLDWLDASRAGVDRGPA
jgi:phosphoglycolate phosphatase